MKGPCGGREREGEERRVAGKGHREARREKCVRGVICREWYIGAPSVPYYHPNNSQDSISFSSLDSLYLRLPLTYLPLTHNYSLTCLLSHYHESVEVGSINKLIFLANVMDNSHSVDLLHSSQCHISGNLLCFHQPINCLGS